MPEPQKEYRARIWVKLTDELLPSPVLSKEQLTEMLQNSLSAGEPDSPVAGVSVDDPRR